MRGAGGQEDCLYGSSRLARGEAQKLGVRFLEAIREFLAADQRQWSGHGIFS
jgi:hypothetical protein